MNRMVGRAMALAFALPALLILTTGMVVAGEEEREPVVWELTLSGDVDTDDSFGIFHQCDTTPDCAFIHDYDIVCSADDELNELYGWERCQSRTYRMTYDKPAGSTIDYAIAFWDEELSGMPQNLLRDSVTVPDGGITLRLEYDYSRGSAPAVAPTSPPALPDTAVAPGPSVLPALASWTVFLLLVAAFSTVAWRCNSTDRPPASDPA